MNWQDKTTVQKGDLGEQVVDAFLMERGLIPYASVAEKAHPFDRLVASENKRQLFIAETKSKSRRKYYPDTGINLRHLEDYQHIQCKYGIQVYLFFIDEEWGCVYGNRLSTLLEPREITHNGRALNYPLHCRGIVYFPVAAMEKVGDLDDEVVCRLRELTTKSEAYLPGI